MSDIRKSATEALLNCGIPMNQSGFLYILDAMELFTENGSPITNMRMVYELIARKRKHNATDIMENIRYSIEFGYENCRTGGWLTYFGLTYTPKTNGNYLAFMWNRWREEECKEYELATKNTENGME